MKLSVFNSKTLGYIILGILTLGSLLAVLGRLSAPQTMLETPEPMTLRTPEKTFKASKVFKWEFIPGKEEKDRFCVTTELGEECATELTIFFQDRAIIDFYPLRDESHP